MPKKAGNNPYADLVSQLEQLDPRDADFRNRLNELISIIELLTTLNTARTLEETLDISLLTMIGQYLCRKGAILIKSAEGWQVGIAKGLKPGQLNLDELPRDRLIITYCT